MEVKTYLLLVQSRSLGLFQSKSELSLSWDPIFSHVLPERTHISKLVISRLKKKKSECFFLKNLFVGFRVESTPNTKSVALVGYSGGAGLDLGGDQWLT